MRLSFFYKLIFLSPVLLFTIPKIVHSAEPDKTIICPAEIICSRDKSIGSCTPSGNDLKYWDFISENGAVKKGKYTFSGVERTLYQFPTYDPTVNRSVCKYDFNDQNLKNNQWLSIYSRVDPYIEAYPSPMTNWEINGYSADCKATDPKLCPFAESPAMKISINIQSSANLDIYANGIRVTKYGSLGNQEKPHILSMYRVWDACSDNGLCLLHLIVTQGAGTLEIGSILVDMSDKMKVKFIYPSCGTGYSLSLNSEIQNLIEIKAH